MLFRSHAERLAAQQVRQQAGQATRRVAQQLTHLERQTQRLEARAARLAQRAETGPLAKRAARQAELETKLAERQATLQAIDLTQPMFERDLEKDQIMANFQAILFEAHRWCCTHYCSGAWTHLELESALARISRQRGQEPYAVDPVTLTLAAFAERAEQDGG